MFGIKRRFQWCKGCPPRFTDERIKFGYPLEKVRLLLLSTNLAREWLQIDTDLLRIITSTADERFIGTNIDDLERPWTPKIGVFSQFFYQFLAAIHILRLNCAETIQDRLGQAASEMFGITRRFKRCKAWHPRFTESSVRAHQIWVPPWKSVISATVNQCSTRMVADRHRLAAYHNKHCRRSSHWYHHRWPWRTLNPPK